MGSPLPDELTGVLREFATALTKATMYPPGHRFARETAARFTEHLAVLLEERGSLTLGFTPRTILLDGAPIEPLPAAFREFGQKLHRRNIGTVHMVAGVGAEEVGAMLTALADQDAEQKVGREGLRSDHLRVEPLTYEVLAFGDAGIDEDLEGIFWARLVEAAFGHRLAEGDPVPTPGQLAEAINERVTESTEKAGRVYEALSAFASALHSRGERNVGSARRRFVEVLSALSRPAATRLMVVAPSRISRRRFMRETLEQVPPVLLLQLLESVADADEAPISEHLRWLLAKLAGGESTHRAAIEGTFATEVMGLIEQWDGVRERYDPDGDVRLVVEPARMVALGLQLQVASAPVLEAARVMAEGGRLAEVLQMLDHGGNDRATADTISASIVDPELLGRLLGEPSPDWALVERVALHSGHGAVGPLLDALDTAQSRAVRRRLIDLVGRLGPGIEPLLITRLEQAEWHLARNILSILATFDQVEHVDEVSPLLQHDDARVRFEAIKVLLRDEQRRDRTITEALESGDPAMARIALAAIGPECPPHLVAPVLGIFALDDEELILSAIRLIAESPNPLIVPQLLALVREKRGVIKRWRLRPPTPDMLAALEVLAARWRRHRPVVVMLQQASRSRDPLIQAVLARHA